MSAAAVGAAWKALREAAQGADVPGVEWLVQVGPSVPVSSYAAYVERRAEEDQYDRGMSL